MCDCEFIYVQLKVNKKLVNFICIYKPPIDNDAIFIGKLELLLLTINPNDPLVILGDLNLDALNDNNTELNNFLLQNNFTNWIKTPTRIASKHYVHNNSIKISISSLDVLITNDQIVKHAGTIDCPFSDHKFIFGSLKFDKLKSLPTKILTRKLNEENLLRINYEISKTDFSTFNSIEDVDLRWLELKSNLINIVDEVAPLREITFHDRDQSFWFDDELLDIKYQRDSAYKNFVFSKSDTDYFIYINSRRAYNTMLNSKMIEYFKRKTANNFRNSKKS